MVRGIVMLMMALTRDREMQRSPAVEVAEEGSEIGTGFRQFAEQLHAI